MNQQYVDTVRLLLAAAPAVFRSPRFALKGGTALNLFAHDMPRLSVDIDVVFTDHNLNREDALQAIAADLKTAKSAISALGFRAHLPTAKGGENVKLLVEGNGQRIKVEVNFVLRGTVLPVTKRPLVPRAQELFTTEIILPVLDLPELYGGKLVAAMDRQRPETCSTYSKCGNAPAGARLSWIASSRILPGTTARFMKCCFRTDCRSSLHFQMNSQA